MKENTRIHSSTEGSSPCFLVHKELVLSVLGCKKKRPRYKPVRSHFAELLRFIKDTRNFYWEKVVLFSGLFSFLFLAHKNNWKVTFWKKCKRRHLETYSKSEWDHPSSSQSSSVACCPCRSTCSESKEKSLMTQNKCD